jgi:hypothetical protein
LVLDDGCIVGSGTHEKLMEICDVYQEIYYSQFPDEKKSVKDVATNIKDNRQLTAKEVTV